MAASTFSRLYRKVMKRALSPLGFRRKGSVFWRERDGIIHVIALDRSPFDGGFTVGVAIQPLLRPSDAFILSLGSRLDSLGQGIPHRWQVPAETSEMEQVLERFALKVVEVALPWLDRFLSTRDIVEIDRRNGWGVEPIEWSARKELVGLCALDAGMFRIGKRMLKQVYQRSYSDLDESYREIGIDVPQWARERQQVLQEFLELLECGDYDGIRRRLEYAKQRSREELGLK